MKQKLAADSRARMEVDTQEEEPFFSDSFKETDFTDMALQRG